MLFLEKGFINIESNYKFINDILVEEGRNILDYIKIKNITNTTKSTLKKYAKEFIKGAKN